MLRRIWWDVPRIRYRRSCDVGRDDSAGRDVLNDGAVEATNAQYTDTADRVQSFRRREGVLVVRAPIRTADPVDRIYQREKDDHQDDGKPAHLAIIDQVPPLCVRSEIVPL
jgi:hypothetical protein